MENKKIIIEMLRSTNRPGIERLLEWMDANGFYDAPCSSKYHLAMPGGLAQHSLNVANIALSLINAFYVKSGKTFSNDVVDSVIIAALLHDLGKAGQFGKPAYKRFIRHPEMITPENFKDPTLFMKDTSIAYETNKELLYIPHEVRSIAIASKFIDLTEQEQFAILYHNGLYGELQSIKNSETELYMILHFADLWACKVVEGDCK